MTLFQVQQVQLNNLFKMPMKMDAVKIVGEPYLDAYARNQQQR
jgi:hypothetical protein